ncbi:glucose-6-phosphate isomerase [Nitratifractor sp.]
MIDYRLTLHHETIPSTRERMEEAFGRLVREREEGIAGYYNLPVDTALVIDEVKARAASIPEQWGCETIVVVGIGGSSLGAKALDQILRPAHPEAKEILFLENPDPLEIHAKFERINKEKTLFIVISKSGGTIETTSIFKALIARFGLDLEGADRHRVLTITDKGSILHSFAQEYGLDCYFIPANVGGRFSVLSAVGIVPLTLAGYETGKILEGAREMVDAFFKREADHLLEKGAFLAENWEQYRINVLFAYGSYFEDFTKWYVQLWGESLGKIDLSGNSVGLTPAGHIGSVDQHSFLQLIIEGPRDKTVTFLQVENFGLDIEIPKISLKHIEKNDYINGHSFGELLNAECDATREAVNGVGVPTDLIRFDRLSERNLGELILYYELLTSIVGAMLGINTYDQPGVELGKKILVKKFQNKDR